MSPQKRRNEPDQLLAEQLSSISTSLAQAAKRRESDLQTRATRKPAQASGTERAKNILEEFEEIPESFAPTTTKGDPKQMLADLKRNACSLKLKATLSSASHDDLNEFRIGFSNLFSLRQEIKATFSAPFKAETGFSNVPSSSSPEKVGTAITHYGDTLLAENATCDTETAVPNNNSFFSNKPDEDKDLQEKEAYVQRCEDNLKPQIQQAMSEYQAMIDAMMERRVVVTNIAADAELYDLALVFEKFDVQEYCILKERNPINGTKAAYVDFCKKQSAEEASRIHEYIFGLKLRVRLATKVFKK